VKTSTGVVLSQFQSTRTYYAFYISLTYSYMYDTKCSGRSKRSKYTY